MLKEEMLELASAASDPEAKRAVLGDCLRASLLRSFHEAEAFLSVALVSKDEAGLEFALLDKKDYKPERWLFAAKRRLRFMGLDPRIAFARKLTVHQGWVKVPGLLAEAGLPDDPADPLGVRIQISLTPPVNGVTSVAIVERFGLRFGVKRTG